jgi:hypothetical protein
MRPWGAAAPDRLALRKYRCGASPVVWGDRDVQAKDRLKVSFVGLFAAIAEISEIPVGFTGNGRSASGQLPPPRTAALLNG